MNWSHKSHKSYKESGFTLVELLLVIALLGLVLGSAYTALDGTYRSWSHNEAINPYIASTNATLYTLSQEIRSAESPTASEQAVKVLDSGKQLIIYKYNLAAATDPWEQICYRYSGSVLQRAVQKAATGEAVATLDFADDSAEWKDLLTGVAEASQENSFQTNATTGKVDIALAISDVERPDHKRFGEYKVASSYYPRNLAPGSLYSEEIEEEEEAPNVPLHKIELLTKYGYFSHLDLQVNETKVLKVRFWPANTTDRTVTVAGAENYVSIVQDADDPTLIKVKGTKKTPIGWDYYKYQVTLTPGSDSFWVRVRD